MNLREMVSYVFDLLGDPAERESAIFGEVVRNLNHGQHRVSNLLPNVEREKFATTNTQAAVNGTETYDTPSDLLDIRRVTYAGVELNRQSLDRLAAIDRNPTWRGNKGRQQFFYEIGSTKGLTKIGILPVPVDTSNIVIWYTRRPIEFHDAGTYNGTVTPTNSHTGAGAPTEVTSNTTTVFHDAVAPFAADRGATPTDTSSDVTTTNALPGQSGFWNDAEVRFTTGNLAGQKRRVTSFRDYVAAGVNATNTADGILPKNAATTNVASYGRFVFATVDAWPGAPVSGGKFELDQVSVMPVQFHDLICLWAAFLLAPKVKRDPMMFFNAFVSGLQGLGIKHTQNIEANMPGETGAGRMNNG